jgi:hypothetical protein
MKDIEIDLPPAQIPSAAKLESLFTNATLRITLRGTLAAYPGSVHWHLKEGHQRGTLEVTLWPPEGRIWLSVQDGRRAEWIAGAVARLQTLLR